MPEPPDFETVNNASAETTGLLGVKYTPVQGLSIRDSHGTGFVPPDVTHLGTPTRKADYRSPTPDPKRGNTALPFPIPYIYATTHNLAPDHPETHPVRT